MSRLDDLRDRWGVVSDRVRENPRQSAIFFVAALFVTIAIVVLTATFLGGGEGSPRVSTEAVVIARIQQDVVGNDDRFYGLSFEPDGSGGIRVVGEVAEADEQDLRQRVADSVAGACSVDFTRVEVR